MIYLLLAILCSATISIIMRLSTDKVTANVGMLMVNYLTCLVVAGAYTGFGGLFPDTPGMGGALGMGALHGMLYLASFALLQLNVKKNGVVLSATFMKLGLLVPMAASILLFGEMPGMWQIAGFVIAIAAIVLINLERGAESGRFGWGLILLLLLGGGGDAMAKVFEEWGNAELEAQFLFYTFLTALLLCIALLLVRRERIGRYELLFGVVIGVPNFFSARFLLRSLETVPAVIAYPTYSIATLFIVTLSGILLFKEKLKKRQWAAVGMILVALALLNT